MKIATFVGEFCLDWQRHRRLFHGHRRAAGEALRPGRQPVRGQPADSRSAGRWPSPTCSRRCAQDGGLDRSRSLTKAVARACPIRPADQLRHRGRVESRSPPQNNRVEFATQPAGSASTAPSSRTLLEGHVNVDSWLLYGANGYTGELIAREAVARGMRPVLAGRSERKRSQRSAAELHCPSAACSTSTITTRAVFDALAEVAAVLLHCAGPFSQHRSVDDARLPGDARPLSWISPARSMCSSSPAARARQSPALRHRAVSRRVGFDVVRPPTASPARLKEDMPDATHLALGFDSRAGLSKGTAKTAIESAGKRLVRAASMADWSPKASPRGTRRIDFGAGEKSAKYRAFRGAMSVRRITRRAFRNIEVYTASSQKSVCRHAAREPVLRPLLRQGWVDELVKFNAAEAHAAAAKNRNEPTIVLTCGARSTKCRGRSENCADLPHLQWLLS